MGGSPVLRWMRPLLGLPRSLLKQFIVHFDPPGAPLPGGPLGAPRLPSLSFQEARELAAYRVRQWFLPRKGAPPGEPLEERSQGAPPQSAGLPAVWPAAVPLPESPPPPHAADVPEGLLRVQALGHGSFLLQTRGPPGGPGAPLSILVDPFFSKRAGPWGRIGVARVRRPAVALSSLPPIDLVLLTSCAYDSLDVGALLQLHEFFSPVLVGPRGALGPLYLPPKLRASAYPLQWGEGPLRLGGAIISLLPAAAAAPSRFLLDKGIGGWGAFCLTLGPHQVYVGGAQGFCPPLLSAAAAAAQQQRLSAALQQTAAAIRDKYEALWGPLEVDDPSPQAQQMAAELAAARNRILQQQQQEEEEKGEGPSGALDLSLLPIGGYEPAALLQRFHMSPEQAVEAHRLLGSRVTVASRFDVLPVGGEPYGEAPLRAEAACAERGLPFNPHLEGTLPPSGGPPGGPTTAAQGPQGGAPRGFYALQPGEAIYV
ncbi:hypothetical protein Efla_002322 [Eimeria flavescens]